MLDNAHLQPIFVFGSKCLEIKCEACFGIAELIKTSIAAMTIPKQGREEFFKKKKRVSCTARCLPRFPRSQRENGVSRVRSGYHYESCEEAHAQPMRAGACLILFAWYVSQHRQSLSSSLS